MAGQKWTHWMWFVFPQFSWVGPQPLSLVQVANRVALRPSAFLAAGAWLSAAFAVLVWFWR
jgi:uncharacterized protein (DUF1810 family)